VRHPIRILAPVIAGMALAITSLPAAAAVDEEAAMETLHRNECTKCHDVKKTKKGPSYKKVAEKYKGKADAKEKLLYNVTKEPLVKLEDGTEQKHKLIDTTNKKELDNLFEFILSRQ
jgi:cytochrome c